MTPLSAFLSSHLQQNGFSPAVEHILHQCSMLKYIQRTDSLSKFNTSSTGQHEMSVPFFSDAARPDRSAHLGFIESVAIGKVEDKSSY